MKTSIRLALTSLASFVTLAASGAPLPFLDNDRRADAPQGILLAPEGLDGQGLAPFRSGDLQAAYSSSTRQ